MTTVYLCTCHLEFSLFVGSDPTTPTGTSVNWLTRILFFKVTCLFLQYVFHLLIILILDSLKTILYSSSCITWRLHIYSTPSYCDCFIPESRLGTHDFSVTDSSLSHDSLALDIAQPVEDSRFRFNPESSSLRVHVNPDSRISHPSLEASGASTGYAHLASVNCVSHYFVALHSHVRATWPPNFSDSPIPVPTSFRFSFSWVLAF